MRQFNRVGVVVDLRHDSASLFSYAKEFVVINKASITFLCVSQIALTEAQQHNIHGHFMKSCDFDFTIEFFIGLPIREITQYTIAHQLDILLVESEGEISPFNRYFHGSLRLSLMRNTPCPIWLTKRTLPKDYQRIIVAVNANEHAEEQRLNDKLIEIGTSYAKAHSAECILATAWTLESESMLSGPFINAPEDEIAQLREEQRAESTLAFNRIQQRNKAHLAGCQTLMLKGYPALAISEYVNHHDIDLVIMGTMARGGLKGFLIGNVAEAIINQVNCSIMAVKPDGFVSPLSD